MYATESIEKVISIESTCGGLLILTVESAGGIYGVLPEVEDFANIGKLDVFRLRGQLVIGRQDATSAVVVAYVDFI